MGHNRSNSTNLFLSISLLILLITGVCPKAAAQALCLSQFALANAACTFVEQLSSEHHHGSGSHIHHHHHHRHHRHRHHHQENPKDSACCRRLAGINNACICQMMARMPLFVTKSNHSITIAPAHSCNVTYECGSNI